MRRLWFFFITTNHIDILFPKLLEKFIFGYIYLTNAFDI